MPTLSAAAAPSDRLAARALTFGPRPAPRHPKLTVGVLAAGGTLVVGAGTGLGPVDGVVALIAVVLGLVVLERPAVGALTLAAVTPAVAGLRRGLPVPGLRLSEILIVGLATLVIVSADRTRQRPWRLFDWLALGYAALTLGLAGGDLLVSGRPSGNETLGTLVGPFQYLLLYRAVLVGLPTADGRRRALRWMLLASVPISGLAILQEFHLLGVRSLIPHLTGVNIDTTFGTEDSGRRATSLFPHWQVLAGYELWIGLLAVALALDPRQRVVRRPTLLTVLALCVGAVLSTVTFSVMLALVAGGLVLGVFARRGGRVAAGLLAAVAIALLVFAPALEIRYHQQFVESPGVSRPAFVPQTVAYRYHVWTSEYVPVLSRRWLTGYGPDLPPSSASFPYTESLYVTLMLRGGLPLLAVYLALMAALFAIGIEMRHAADPVLRATARVAVVGIVLLVPMHTIESYFVNGGMGQLFWITAALLIGGAARSEHHLRTDPHVA